MELGGSSVDFLLGEIYDKAGKMLKTNPSFLPSRSLTLMELNHPSNLEMKITTNPIILIYSMIVMKLRDPCA